MSDISAVEERGIKVVQEPLPEGKTPLSEVARIIRDQGDAIGKGLYQEYGPRFESQAVDGKLDDPENHIFVKQHELFQGATVRDISVYLAPEGVKEPEVKLTNNFVRIAFRYEPELQGSGWNLRSIMVHKNGYMTPKGETDEQLKTDRWLNKPDNQIDMKDMERTLGKYLQPGLPSAGNSLGA